MSAYPEDSTGLIDKIDKGVAEYYSQRGRNNYYNSDGDGIFKLFCNDNGFEDEDVQEELQETDGNESTLTDFDDNFPFDNKPANDDDKFNFILKVLKHIANTGSYGSPDVKLDLKMCADVTAQDMALIAEKYQQQMKCFGDQFKKNVDLLWFFAVSEKCNYPFLTYMVDSYTRDSVKHFCANEKQLSVSQWAQTNPFMIALKKKYPKQKIEQQLESAIKSYSTRIMHRLKLNPTIKIKDDLKEICEYITSIPAFIKKLMERFLAVPPFQVDLIIAVKGVQSVVSDTGEDDEDDDDDDDDDNKETEEKKLDPNTDHIGDIQGNLERFPVAHCYWEREKNKDIQEEEQLRNAIARVLGQNWNDFRTVLSEFNGKHKSDDEKIAVKIEFDSDTYPQNRRFAIFVDRRDENKDEIDDEKKNEKVKDRIVFFQPPNDCSTIKNGHVPEIGFELIRQCIIPRRDNYGKVDNITAQTNVCGQLITFMFVVEQKDEIKCYIVWNGQTMRFEYDHMMLVLPFLFEENKENIECIQSKKNELPEIQQLFKQETKDNVYAKFCKKLKAWKSY